MRAAAKEAAAAREEAKEETVVEETVVEETVVEEELAEEDMPACCKRLSTPQDSQSHHTNRSCNRRGIVDRPSECHRRTSPSTGRRCYD